MLKWSRKRCRIEIDDLAERVKRTPEAVAEWEDGVTEPSYTTLEQLASIYKVPLAVFFFSEPPAIEDVVTQLRRLPNYELERLSADTFRKLRIMQSYQDSLSELMGPHSSDDSIHKSVSPRGKSVVEFAHEIRAAIGISLDDQFRFRSADSGFKRWRHAIEEAGVFTFKDSFKDTFVSGLCLLDAEYPVIVVNNSNSFSRQIFTMIHELSHILYGVSGITDWDLSYIELMDAEQKRIEIRCNQVAAEVLVPEASFAEQAPKDAHPETVSELATQYCVSREVILRRYLDAGQISVDEYEQRAGELNRDFARQKAEGSRGNYYLTKLAYLGEGFTHTAFEMHQSGRIDRMQLGDHLRVNMAHIDK